MPENRKRDQIQWTSTGDPATVDDTRLAYPGQLGGIFTDKNGAEFRFVQGDSSMAVSPFPGATMWWSNRAQYKVTTDPTKLGRGQVAGCIPVFQSDGVTRVNSKGVGNYFFVQRGGVGVIKFVDAPTASPTAAGLIVIPSATAGKADCLAAGSAATYPPIGRSAGVLNATTMECSVEIDIPDATD